MTGGGKTAIYVEAIAPRSSAAGRRSCSSPRSPSPCRSSTGSAPTSTPASRSLHSGLGEGERADEWRRIRARRRRHRRRDAARGRSRRWPTSGWSSSTRSTRPPTRATGRRASRPATPRSSWRELAGAAVVLGSATPAVDSVGRARGGPVPAGRAAGARRRARAARSRSSTSARSSRRATAGCCRTARGGARGARRRRPASRRSSSINRRGTASVVLCRDCGHVQACPDCERPLVYHQAGTTLRCHHCGRATPLATRCPNCGSPRIRYLGGGTERVEREVRERFPGLRVGRLDRDVVERRGAAERVIDAFAAGRLDVLVGTSLVAKGLDVPSVTLVGVVSADVALNLPDERAAERTYQLLAQAVGRAGRGERAGRRDHPDLPARASRRSGPSSTATRPRSTTRSSRCASGSARRRSGGSSS